MLTELDQRMFPNTSKLLALAEIPEKDTKIRKAANGYSWTKWTFCFGCDEFRVKKHSS